MNILILLFFIFFVPILALIVWFALSSCLGDNLRTHVAGARIDPRDGAYGRSYARNLGTNPNTAGSEMIEMEAMMRYDSDDEL